MGDELLVREGQGAESQSPCFSPHLENRSAAGLRSMGVSKPLPPGPQSLPPGARSSQLPQSALGEKRVRRRLRHLAAEAHHRHRSRMLWWTLAMLPQLPLLVRGPGAGGRGEQGSALLCTETRGGTALAWAGKQLRAARRARNCGDRWQPAGGEAWQLALPAFPAVVCRQCTGNGCPPSRR